MSRKHCLCILAALVSLCSCGRNYTPKPRSYMRMAVPEKTYTNYGFSYCSFRCPVYAQVVPVPSKPEYPATDWFDIKIPDLNATIYMSHIRRPDLDSCITGTLFFIQRHMSKSTGVEEWEINDPAARRYGYLYHLKGRDVASPYQFYLTDSSRHFIRGSLSINCTPNNDSLAPVLSFLKMDIDTLLASWRWR